MLEHKAVDTKCERTQETVRLLEKMKHEPTAPGRNGGKNEIITEMKRSTGLEKKMMHGESSEKKFFRS